MAAQAICSSSNIAPGPENLIDKPEKLRSEIGDIKPGDQVRSGTEEADHHRLLDHLGSWFRPKQIVALSSMC